MTTQTQDGVVSHRIGPDGLVVVRVHDGDIRVRGVTGDLATVRAADGEPLNGLDIESGDRSLSIATQRGPDFFGISRRDGGRGRGRTKHLHLEVPAGATVVVEGASADLDVRGLHGDQRYRSASGDLVLADVSGSLTIEAVSGDIEVDADGPASVTARTVSGDLDLRAGSLTGLRATTTSGDLHIAGRFDGSGPYAIETVSGDARLAPANDVRIEARTIAGDIESELPSHRDDTAGRRALIVGKGGPTVTFRSTSGDLRVVAIRAAAPAPPAPPEPPEPTAPPVRIQSETARNEDDARLEVLRELERGEIDVAEAGRRLEALDIGPPAAAHSDGERDHA